MKSIFDSVTSSNNQKSAIAIKENITTLLKENVAQIMVAKDDPHAANEAAFDLCAVIEAMFLNGLKDGFMNRFRRTLDVDQPCNLSFWHLLMEISHQENIKQVEKLSTIKTEIGQCRAWIRVVLNEALLSSYLKTIKENRKTLARYYHRYGFLYDVECVDIAQTLIEKVEAVTIKLPCNSGILNNWVDFPLSLAGIAYRPMRLNQIAPGVDIAQMLPTSSSKNSETCSIASSIISQSSGIGQIVSLNEDEALKLILRTHADREDDDACEEVAVAPKQKSEKTDQQIQSNSLGSFLNEKSTWSSYETDENKHIAEDNKTNNNPPVTITQTPDSRPLLERSYSSLVESNFLNGTHIPTPDFRDVLQRLNNDIRDPEKEEKQLETEVIEKVVEVTPPVLEKPKILSLVDQVTVLGNEKGLDAQDYKCFSCQKQFSLASKILVCSFTGNYHCEGCMSPEEIQIPARIIYNWDYKTYKVSQSAFNCIQEIRDDPLVDFKTINPYIYTAVYEMARLQTLRNQLNYLRAYLYTCREPVIEQLQKMMFPREYLYEHIHQYSISDLQHIKDGALASQLEKVVQFGREHVLNCWLCSQKGFLCEFCEDTKPLFPFNTDNVYRCNECSGVSHKTCLNAMKPCPRCKRKQERDLPHAADVADAADTAIDDADVDV